MPKPFTDPRQGRTLILCPIGIGNFIMATPALKALSEGIGPNRLSFLALRGGISAMAEGSGLFGRVYTWDPDREGLRRGASLMRVLRAARFTHSLALFPSSHWKFALFERLARAEFRMGFRYPHQRLPEWIQHHSVPLTDVHDTLQNLRLVEAFLRDSIVRPGDPFLPVEAVPPAGLPSEPFFACHPGSSAERGMIEKRLPPEDFAALIRRAHQETGWKCVLVGGPEEHALRAAVAMDCRDSLLTVETRSMAETAGVLRAARFFLGNDSGLMHVSDAVGTRCAAFFGPTDERRTGPYGYWETRNEAPRHLILRRKGQPACWTLETIGRNIPPEYPRGSSPWRLDIPEAWGELRAWIASL